MNAQPQADPSGTSWRKRIVVVVVLLMLALYGIPFGLAVSGYADTLLQRAVGRHGFDSKVGSASLGWFSPVVLSSSEVNRRDGAIQIEIPRADTDRTLVSLLQSSGDFGEIRIRKPNVNLVLSELGSFAPGTRSIEEPTTATWSARITNGTVHLYDTPNGKPLIHLRDVEALARVENQSNGRMLVIDPVSVLDREDLTPDLCDRGLQFVAPFLARATRLEGTASLSLQELQIPLGVEDDATRTDRLAVAGQLQLHDARAALRSPLISTVVRIASQLAGKPMPDSAQVLEEAEIRFHIHDGQVHHDGFVLILPELSEKFRIETSGAVGFDQQLDLQVTVRVPLGSRADSDLLAKLTAEPVQLRVRGTIDDPKVELGKGQSILEEVAGRLTNAADGDVKSIPGAVGSLLQELRKGDDGKVDKLRAVENVIDVFNAFRKRDRDDKDNDTKSRDD